MTITDLKNKVATAMKNIDSVTAKIIQDNEVKILDYVRVDQLSKGRDSDGNPITKTSQNYSGVYARTYGSEDVGGWGDNSRPTTSKIAGEPYNFEWSGHTLAHFDTSYRNYELTILNTGSSASYLTSFYDNGHKLFEMSEENEERMRNEIIVPNLTEYLQSVFR